MFLGLLDWIDRQLQPGKRASVARKVSPIQDRVNLSPELWLQTIAKAKREAKRCQEPNQPFLRKRFLTPFCIPFCIRILIG